VKHLSAAQIIHYENVHLFSSLFEKKKKEKEKNHPALEIPQEKSF